jgi:hypothetical protein
MSPDPTYLGPITHRHRYRQWVDSNDVGNTCCQMPPIHEIHIKPVAETEAVWKAFCPQCPGWFKYGTRAQVNEVVRLHDERVHSGSSWVVPA